MFLGFGREYVLKDLNLTLLSRRGFVQYIYKPVDSDAKPITIEEQRLNSDAPLSSPSDPSNPEGSRKLA